MEEVLPCWLKEWMIADGSWPQKECIAADKIDDSPQMKLALVQGFTMQSGVEAANVVKAVRNAYHNCSYVVFHEHSFAGRVCNGDTRALKPLLEESTSVGIVISLEETVGAKLVFITGARIENGSIVCRYRKRKAVHTGAHAEGTEVGVWDSTLLKSNKCGVLICFDVENADVRDEMLATNPHIIFNPTWIPPPSSAMRKYESVWVAGWRSALDSMRAKFQRMCGQNNFWLLRCDGADPGPSGTTQLIGPYSSVTAPHNGPCVLVVSIDVSPANHFQRHSAGATRGRTKLEENCGSCYDTRFFAPRLPKGHARRALTAAFQQDRVLAFYDDGSATTFNMRDGRVLSQSLASPTPAFDDATLVVGEKTQCYCRQGRRVCMLDVTQEWKESAQLTLHNDDVDDGDEIDKEQLGRMSFLPSHGLIAVGGLLLDMRRTGSVEARLGGGRHIVTSNVSSFDDGSTLLLAGTREGAATWDLRKLTEGPVVMWTSPEPVLCVEARHHLWWASSTCVRKGPDHVVHANVGGGAPVCALACPVVGLSDGSMLSGGHKFSIYTRPLRELHVSQDGFSLLGVSNSYMGVGLTTFLQNCERQTSLAAGLIL